MFIPNPNLDFYPSRIPDHGVKKAPDPGSATRFLTVFLTQGKKLFSFHFLTDPLQIVLLRRPVQLIIVFLSSPLLLLFAAKNLAVDDGFAVRGRLGGVGRQIQLISGRHHGRRIGRLLNYGRLLRLVLERAGSYLIEIDTICNY
jgi:hypothetical protein